MSKSKFKLTTCLANGITDEQRRDPGFHALLNILPQTYAALMDPKPWTEEMGDRKTLQDDILFEGTQHYASLRAAFASTTRMELHLYPGRKTGTLHGDIELFAERSVLEGSHAVLLTYDFATGKATTGISLD